MGPADLYFNPREEILTVKQTAITIKDHSSVLTFSQYWLHQYWLQSYYISLLFSAIFTAISNFHTIHGHHHLVITSDLIFDTKRNQKVIQWKFTEYVLSTNLQTHLLPFILLPSLFLLSWKNYPSSYLKLISLPVFRSPSALSHATHHLLYLQDT